MVSLVFKVVPEAEGQVVLQVPGFPAVFVLLVSGAEKAEEFSIIFITDMSRTWWNLVFSIVIPWRVNFPLNAETRTWACLTKTPVALMMELLCWLHFH